jgi:hypothetical protein
MLGSSHSREHRSRLAAVHTQGRETPIVCGHDVNFAKYRRKQIAELRPYQPGEPLNGVSISKADADAGSPRFGDMIARNPKNHADQWLVAAQYFADNFEPYTLWN